MIIKSIAKSNEKCSICERTFPQGIIILRKKENNKIICLLCLVEIAELSIVETKEQKGE